MDGFTIGQNVVPIILLVGKTFISLLLVYIYFLGFYCRLSKSSREKLANKTLWLRLLGWCGISVLVGLWIMEMTAFIHYALITSIFFEDKQALVTILSNVAKPVMLTSYLIIGATSLNLIFTFCCYRQAE